MCNVSNNIASCFMTWDCYSKKGSFFISNYIGSW